MNWTEGNLARHSRGRKGKEIVLRQRKHFAKVRSSLTNSNAKISPPSISMFSRPSRSSSPTPHRSSKLSPAAPSSVKKRPRDGGSLQTSRYFQTSSLKLPSPGSLQKEEVEENMRHKRRRLLLKGDWVGTDVQKPIQMEFLKPRVSSRDDPWGSSRPRYQSSKSRLCRLLGVKTVDGQLRAPGTVVRTSTPVTRCQLRVRVGSLEKALDASSNATSSMSRYRDVQGNPDASHIRGSEHQQNRTQDAAHGHSTIGQEYRMYESQGDSSHGPISTSSPLLYHPIPHRPHFPQLLHSPSCDSDDTASIKAQVGPLQPEIPSSQAEQNEAWRGFVGGAERDRSRNDLPLSDSSYSLVSGAISPGISHLGLRKRAGHVDEDQESALQPSLGDDTENESTENEERAVQLLAKLNHEQQQGTQNGDECGENSTSSQEENERSLADLIQSDQPKAADDNIPQHDGGLGSPSSLSPDCHNSGVSPAGQSARTTAGKSQNNIKQLAGEDSDEVCLLMPLSSPSIAGQDVQGLFEASPVLSAGQIDRHHMSPIHQPRAGEVKKLATHDSPHNTEAQPNSQPETLKNDNAMWRQFVFGEVNEHLEQVLADARTRAARKLRPSDPFTSTDEICQSDEAHALGNLSPETSPSLKYSLAIDAQNIAEQSESFEADVSIIASISHQATVAESPRDPLSEIVPACSNTTIHTDQATVGSSAPSKPSLTASSDTMDKPPRRSDIWDMPTSDSENASLRSRPRPLQNHGEGDEGFRFSRPRPFIGKKTSHLDEGRQIALSLGQIRGKTVTRRRQKRSGNTRTDIRKLPNFNSDPIEEVEEHASRQRNEEPSLFGPLDMEENA